MSRVRRPASRLILSVTTLFLVLGCANGATATATAAATAPPEPAQAQVSGDPFVRTWQRTDGPVAGLQVGRTWMWGPESFTGDLVEDYVEAPGGERRVQYYDKSRMELTDPTGAADSPWLVTNGLLVVELMRGHLQVGDDSFAPRRPSVANVAGDDDDTAGPTYATLALVAGAAPLAEGAQVVQTLARNGAVGSSTTAGQWAVTAGPLSPETGHRVASVFWAFMNSAGLVDDGSGLVTAPLFENPYYATGLPITEAYWATVRVRGVSQEVLVQAFERRVLTYTPGNPQGWQVEAGNVGRHYHAWRYEHEDFAQVQLTGDGGPVLLSVEVADSERLRSCGLMHRYLLLENQAMLFVYDGIATGAFWNRNTEIPLQLAWIDSNGTIVGISDMAAADRSAPDYPVLTFPTGAYQYVIEANAGWFTDHGLGAGDTVELAAALAHGSQGAEPLCEVLGYEERGT